MNPQGKKSYAKEPNGRDSLVQFCRMFRETHTIFKTLLSALAIELMWATLHNHTTDCFNKPAADLQLKFLSALLTLADEATHFVVSTNAYNISKEPIAFFQD